MLAKRCKDELQFDLADPDKDTQPKPSRTQKPRVRVEGDTISAPEQVEINLAAEEKAEISETPSSDSVEETVVAEKASSTKEATTEAATVEETQTDAGKSVVETTLPSFTPTRSLGQKSASHPTTLPAEVDAQFGIAEPVAKPDDKRPLLVKSAKSASVSSATSSAAAPMTLPTEFGDQEEAKQEAVN